MTTRHEAFSYPDLQSSDYALATPFPHVVIKNVWNRTLLVSCKEEIDGFDGWDGEKDFYGSRKKQYCGNITKLPQSVCSLIAEASQPKFLRWLEELTGEKSLIPDPYLEGGGVHRILSGGFLKVHADFNWNQRLSLYRRLNILIYLNPGWKREWGGCLELWNRDMSECALEVPPELGTMVIFTTDDQSFHGHPHEMRCPEGIYRDSIALYYYSPIKPSTGHAGKRNSTDYHAIAGDDFTLPTTSLVSRLKARVKKAVRG